MPADRIRDLNTRIARIAQSAQDAMDDRARAEESEDILRLQLSSELEIKRALRADITDSNNARITLDLQTQSIQNHESD